MKFTINSRVLRSALESANKGINPKPTIPALANFLLEGDGLTLTITGSDGNTTIKETLDCEAEGKALLPTNLLELVRTLNEGDVTIETTDANATISWKNGHSTIPAFKTEDYPEIADYEGEYATINGEQFARALAHTLPHIAYDEMRPIMGGVLFRAKEGGKVDVVASDAHTLGLCTIQAEGNATLDFVAPANAVKLVGNATKAGDVQVADNETSIFFRVGSTTVIARKIVGKFPRYESVIPQSYASALTVEKASILNSIRRVLVCASKASGHIKLTLGMLETVIEAQDLSFNTSAREIPDEVKYDGSDLIIGFKGEYLMKCIAAIEGDELKINFNAPNKAAVVTSEDDDSIALVMPVQV